MSVAAGAPVTAVAFGSKASGIYVAAGNKLVRYDIASAKSTGKLDMPGKVVAVATDPSQSIGFAALQAPAELVTFSLRPLAIKRVQNLNGGTPSALLYAPAAHAVVVESRAASTLTGIEITGGQRIRMLHLTGSLGQMASNARGTLYVDNSSHGAIDAVDIASMANLGAIPVRGCKAPTGLAMDQVGRRLFVSCRDGMRSIVDADLGFTFEELPSSARGAGEMVFSFHPFGPKGPKGLAVSVGSNGRVAFIEMASFVKYRADGNLTLPGACEAMAFDPNTHQLWLALEHGASAPAATGTRVELWTLAPTVGTSP
ncbi:MAG: hypothetical protein EPN38_07965 [Rhodanobacteraceae bacterium]|nr:MAG: hypothetical protein EPN38_07965 [Rhodanobacteraceae bacterium]